MQRKGNKYGLLTKCEVKMAGYWPSSLFANLVNKGFIIWLLVKFCLRDTAGSPEGARWLHLPPRVANYSARFGSSCPLAELDI